MYRSALFVVVSIACLIKGLKANYVYENEEWVQQQAEKARPAALEAYHPDPLQVTGQFNFHVRKALERANTTRRQLGHVYRGPCRATNPIERCWRCRANWARNRKRLAKCVKGFGRKTAGGKYGLFYRVTDPSDDDVVNPRPGTLRYAVIQKRPLWIVFARSMIITLSQELIVQSDKTIDGRGVNVHIAYGAGITLQFVQNVIIHGIHIHNIVPKSGGIVIDSIDHKGLRGASDGYDISIFGSSNIWIDHVTMKDCYDGLIDAIEGSTGITISNTHFSHHNFTLLFGAHDSSTKDAIMQVTLAFNHFGEGLVYRMPRCRWGFFHIVNNDYTHWNNYAIGGSAHPTIISQGNRFIAPLRPELKQITHRDGASEDKWMKWTWRSQGDLLMNGAFFRESGAPLKNKPFGRLDMIKPRPGTFVKRLTRFAGALKCQKRKKC